MFLLAGKRVEWIFCDGNAMEVLEANSYLTDTLSLGLLSQDSARRLQQQQKFIVYEVTKRKYKVSFEQASIFIIIPIIFWT